MSKTQDKSVVPPQLQLAATRGQQLSWILVQVQRNPVY